MNSLGMFLSNQYWYGFFLGSMGVIGLALVVVLTLKARRSTSR